MVANLHMLLGQWTGVQSRGGYQQTVISNKLWTGVSTRQQAVRLFLMCWQILQSQHSPRAVGGVNCKIMGLPHDLMLMPIAKFFLLLMCGRRMNEYDQKVVHRDLKASNIMLDSDFNARLGDFGLARILDKEKSRRPLLLEIVCGLRTGTRIGEFCFLVYWVWSLHREGRILDAIEERLGDEYVVEEAQKVLVLALACCHLIASERPRTQAIVHIISGLVPVPYVPPFKPVFVWPSMPTLEDDDISSLGSTTETESFPTTHLGSGFTPQSISRELYAREKFKSV
ncbi:hypothetical protein RHMOL_Rhmol08G0028900 [Rhododendron molle]|uniref:Uncharacterized protein n=1 Tax=Rhododendron molle TaxID=49168 RepID=A0ACC0MKK0_RHOML|nr:hypothetical protein RHMOL_Rhmol08G0028900 [Rhododendron molle]